MVEIHPSGLSSFFDCGYRWYRDNIFMPIRGVGIAAHLGSSIHKAAETYYKECISEAKWAKARDDFKGVAIDYLRDRCKTEQPIDIKEVDFNTIEKQAAANSMSYINNAKKLNREKIPLGVEKHYEAKVNSPIISKVSGTLDIVGENFIADIKTMSKLKNPSGYLMQQAVYGFLRQKSGEEVEDFIIHRVVVPKQICDSVSIIDSLDNPFTKAQSLIDKSKLYLETLIKTCNEFYKTGNELLFRGNPSSILCNKKYCPYFSECKYSKEFK